MYYVIRLMCVLLGTMKAGDTREEEEGQGGPVQPESAQISLDIRGNNENGRNAGGGGGGGGPGRPRSARISSDQLRYSREQ